jgi:ATP-binding cassette, subfamily C, bacterial
VLGFRQLVRIARRAGYRQTDTTSSLVTYVSDALNNIKPIKAMEREALFMSFFFQKIKALRRALLIRTLAKQGLNNGQQAIQAVAIAIGAYVAAVHMGIPLPELVVLGIIFAQVVGCSPGCRTSWRVTAEIESAYWRTQELIDELIEQAEPDPGRTDSDAGSRLPLRRTSPSPTATTRSSTMPASRSRRARSPCSRARPVPARPRSSTC